MDISIRAGETLEITVVADDDTAQTVEIIVADSEGSLIINETESFTTVDGKRVATISTSDTNYDVGEYEYMLKIVYADGYIEKLPDSNCDDEDCELPKLNICKSLDMGVS